MAYRYEKEVFDVLREMVFLGIQDELDHLHDQGRTFQVRTHASSPDTWVPSPRLVSAADIAKLGHLPSDASPRSIAFFLSVQPDTVLIRKRTVAGKPQLYGLRYENMEEFAQVLQEARDVLRSCLSESYEESSRKERIARKLRRMGCDTRRFPQFIGDYVLIPTDLADRLLRGFK